ncbi:hypothetical protein BDV96DRAFT_217366 [Lophiotrema nucula]|uniref:Uncharacterized protein n=1 Tax=Lophiotrema nucula TaxID=690887 RepID=A0A6A5ZQ45_9PLEO|nr:hypothetical protein BDV96DRAFT_217366 [Lophiotrema nucula]
MASDSSRLKKNAMFGARAPITLDYIQQLASEKFPQAFESLPGANQMWFVNLKFEHEGQYGSLPASCKDNPNSHALRIGTYDKGLEDGTGPRVYAILYSQKQNNVAYIYRDKPTFKAISTHDLYFVDLEEPFGEIGERLLDTMINRLLKTLTIYYMLLTDNSKEVGWYNTFNADFQKACEQIAKRLQPDNRSPLNEEQDREEVLDSSTSGTGLEAHPRKRFRDETSDEEDEESSYNHFAKKALVIDSLVGLPKRTDHRNLVYYARKAQESFDRVSSKYLSAALVSSENRVEKAGLQKRIDELEAEATRKNGEHVAQIQAFRDEIAATNEKNKKVQDDNAQRLADADTRASERVQQVKAEAERRLKEAEERVQAALWQGYETAKASLRQELENAKIET